MILNLLFVSPILFGSTEAEKVAQLAKRINGILDEVGRNNSHWLRTPDENLHLRKIITDKPLRTDRLTYTFGRETNNYYTEVFGGKIQIRTAANYPAAKDKTNNK